MAEVYRLKITLAETHPPIWRRVLVASDATLGDLHLVIQAAFGWLGGHLHEFEVGGERYSADDDERAASDEDVVTLAEIAPPGARLVYTYDFGDNWRHRIDVGAAEPYSQAVSLPACVDGRRSAPPEDCGGPSGYAHFLAAIGDPDHPDHTELVQWVGPYFDPEEFDAADFAEAYSAGPPLGDVF